MRFIKLLCIFSLHSCVKNCQAKTISNEKTILQSNCEAYCTGKLRFSWSLYIFDNINSPEPLNLSSLHEIPQEEFQKMVNNPIDELDLAIKPNALQCDKKYILAFRAMRPSAVLGEQRTTLLVNSPPTGGKRCLLQISIHHPIHSHITSYIHLSLYSLLYDFIFYPTFSNYIHLYIYSFIHLSIYHSIRPLTIYQSVHQYIRPFIYLSLHLRAAFHYRVFSTCVYARKSLNLYKFCSGNK